MTLHTTTPHTTTHRRALALIAAGTLLSAGMVIAPTVQASADDAHQNSCDATAINGPSDGDWVRWPGEKVPVGPVEDGYTFEGWAYPGVTTGLCQPGEYWNQWINLFDDAANASNGVVSYTDANGVLQVGATVTAVKYPNPAELAYDGNGGAGNVDGATGVTDDHVAVADNDYSYDGYEFTGWNTAADGSGTAYAAGDDFTLLGDVTLYAQWQQLAAPAEPTGEATPTAEGTPTAQSSTPTANSPAVTTLGATVATGGQSTDLGGIGLAVGTGALVVGGATAAIVARKRHH